MEDRDINRAVDAICGNTFTPEMLALLDNIIDRGEARALVAAIVANERKSTKTDKEAVHHTMDRLTAFGNGDKPTACLLMACLMPLASDLYLHDVWDAIGLWITYCDSDQLTRRLELLVQSERDEAMRRQYNGIIQFRRQSKNKG